MQKPKQKSTSSETQKIAPLSLTDLSQFQSLFSNSHFALQKSILYIYKSVQPFNPSFNPNPIDQILSLILPHLTNFPIQSLCNWLPILVHIFFVSKSQILQNFLFSLAIKDIPTYIAIRWSLEAYIPDKDEEYMEKIRNKLDGKFVNGVSARGLEVKMGLGLLKAQEIESMIKKKEILSNYVYVLNGFYSQLFTIPEKIKKVQLPERKNQLHAYLKKLFNKFTQNQQSQYCTGVCLPFCHTLTQLYNESYLLVNFVLQQCVPFPTKQRVPFKIVFETINFNDYDNINSDVQTIRKIHTDFKNISSHKKYQQKTSLALPHSYLGPDWSQKLKKITIQSPYGHLPSYRIHSYILKTGDDIRQQHVISLLLTFISKIFLTENLKLYLHPYKILPFSPCSGLIEYIPQTKTLSFLKSTSSLPTLRPIYKQLFGQNFQLAIINFIHSLAGYSIFQYLFQVKDRHNNNILINQMGYLIHIDFGYVLGASPGGMGFEKAHFKFTEDYKEMLEGMDGELYGYFRFLMATGLSYLAKYKGEIMGMVALLEGIKGGMAIDWVGLERRFHEGVGDQELEKIVDGLIRQSYNSYTTGNYDRYQWYTNQIVF